MSSTPLDTASPNNVGATVTAPLPSPAQHSYGTRIRQNSIIKPSARLLQSPDHQTAPRRIKPVPTRLQISPSDSSPMPHNMPVFPPLHVMLHPEDASNKVFLAIGRSFLSVDNRAMTIKDLAEMTLQYGLVCQNVSAAGQAITTFIRNHMQRCETEEDHPVLLRHTLSGTSSDDELLPALHSRTGGAHCTANPESRSTNFRRGTMVWYLSRATGAPCPFTRAGIRICEYGENGKVGVTNNGSRERKRERDRQRKQEQCGQKRKRQLRGHTGSGCESAEEGPKPKIKLTLRLRPSAAAASAASESQSSRSDSIIDLSRESDSSDCDDDSMSVDSSSEDESVPEPAPETTEVPWSLPPYPKRSISIPCYTPSLETFPLFPAFSPSSSNASPYREFRRSPSVPYSVASPPPDSEDEDDGYHVSMTYPRRISSDVRRQSASESDPEWDADFDSDAEHGETETQWESPGPRSPSAPAVPFGDDVFVKEEPRDTEAVQGLLDHWEPLDSNIHGNKVVEVIAKAAAGLIDEPVPEVHVKMEELEFWDWEESYDSPSADWYRTSADELDTRHIKQEDIEYDSPLIPGDEAILSPAATSYVPYSPLSPLSGYPPDMDASPIISASAPSSLGARRSSELAWKDVELLGPDSLRPQDFEDGEWQDANGTVRARAKIQPCLPTFEEGGQSSMSSPPVQGAQAMKTSSLAEQNDAYAHQVTPSINSVSPVDSAPTRKLSPSLPATATQSAPLTRVATGDTSVVVVHTCSPCTPAISATQVEGIPVYQTLLGDVTIFRRIDTDFVNLSNVAAHIGVDASRRSPDDVIVTQGSSRACGTWVPLRSAQDFVAQNSSLDNLLHIFLSENLAERFPSPLQEFYRTSASGRLFNQFGPHFKSTSDAMEKSTSSLQPHMIGEPWERSSVLEWDEDEHVISAQPPYALALEGLRRSTEEPVVPETPLSPTEQEMFQALCSMPDWEKDTIPTDSSCSKDGIVRDADEGLDDDDDDSQSRMRDQPRRRSKRVANANAIATRTRTRSQKRGSRVSLS